MSKYSPLALGRRFTRDKDTGEVLRRDEKIPAVPRKAGVVEYQGIRLPIRVAPGQIINLRKEYIRLAKRFNIDPLGIAGLKNPDPIPKGMKKEDGLYWE